MEICIVVTDIIMMLLVPAKVLCNIIYDMTLSTE